MVGKAFLPVLDERLLMISSMVREDAILLDVGTDHAYIPIYLLKNGMVKTAIASDINKKPLKRASDNAHKFGVFDKITFCLSDGIEGVHPEQYSVSDIIVAGMGGDLIAAIVDRSSYVKNPEIRMILQPMSHAAELRKYLAGNGFCIVSEKLCLASDKYYPCFAVEYDGQIREISDSEAELGKAVYEENNETICGFLSETAKKLAKRIEGKKKGHRKTGTDEELLREVYEIASSQGYNVPPVEINEEDV